MTMWSHTLPQVAATLAATLVAFDTRNPAGQRLIDNRLLKDAMPPDRMKAGGITLKPSVDEAFLYSSTSDSAPQRDRCVSLREHRPARHCPKIPLYSLSPAQSLTRANNCPIFRVPEYSELSIRVGHTFSTSAGWSMSGPSPGAVHDPGRHFQLLIALIGAL
jgi:hypothetical protein